MLGFDGDYPAVQSKAKFFWRFLVKNHKKSVVKHSIEKSILLNFVNLSPTFCLRLKVWNMFKVHNKDTRMTSMDPSPSFKDLIEDLDQATEAVIYGCSSK